MSLIEIKLVINHGGKAKPPRQPAPASPAPGYYQPEAVRRFDMGHPAPAVRPAVAAQTISLGDTASPADPPAGVDAEPTPARSSGLRIGGARWLREAAIRAAGTMPPPVARGTTDGAHAVVAPPTAQFESELSDHDALQRAIAVDAAPAAPPRRRPAIDLSGAATAPARWRTPAVGTTAVGTTGAAGDAVDLRRAVARQPAPHPAGHTIASHLPLPASHPSTPRVAGGNSADDVASTALPPIRPASGPSVRPAAGRRLGLVAAGIIIGLAAVVGGLIWLARFIDGPVTASATLEQARVAAAATPTPAPPGSVQGLYISFNYPAALELYAQVKTDATALEQFNITSKADYRQQIASSVRDLTSGNLDDDASYRFRSMHPDDYTLTPETVNGYRAVLAVKADKTEQTLFVVGAGRLATISVTSTSQKATAAQVMAIIKPTVQLKR